MKIISLCGALLTSLALISALAPTTALALPGIESVSVTKAQILALKRPVPRAKALQQASEKCESDSSGCAPTSQPEYFTPNGATR